MKKASAATDKREKAWLTSPLTKTEQTEQALTVMIFNCYSSGEIHVLKWMYLDRKDSNWSLTFFEVVQDALVSIDSSLQTISKFRVVRPCLIIWSNVNNVINKLTNKPSLMFSICQKLRFQNDDWVKPMSFLELQIATFPCHRTPAAKDDPSQIRRVLPGLCLNLVFKKQAIFEWSEIFAMAKFKVGLMIALHYLQHVGTTRHLRLHWTEKSSISSFYDLILTHFPLHYIPLDAYSYCLLLSLHFF